MTFAIPSATTSADTWQAFVTAAERGDEPPENSHWTTVFGGLLQRADDGLTVFGQIGQTIDGRIAAESGHSHYINGPEGITHLHRMRALADVVVVGVGTVLADDPLLTVRKVEGRSPARVVLDRTGRAPATAKIFNADGCRRFTVTDSTRGLPGVEQIRLRAPDGQFAPLDIVHALSERGFRRILIEGGAQTVSAFVQAGCLDRLHIMVAPFVLGSGCPSFQLPAAARVDTIARWKVQSFSLGEDILFDCALWSQRDFAGTAKKST
jgi:riboflavin-specific deaminase-like protein